MKRRKLKNRLVQIPIWGLLIFLAIIMLVPVIWSLLSAFKPDMHLQDTSSKVKTLYLLCFWLP